MLTGNPSGVRTLLASAMAAGLAGQAPSHHQPPISLPSFPPANAVAASPPATHSPPQRFPAQPHCKPHHTPSGQASGLPRRVSGEEPAPRGVMGEQVLLHDSELAAGQAEAAGSGRQQGMEQQLPGQLPQPSMQQLLGGLAGQAGGATLDMHTMAAFQAALQRTKPSSPGQNANRCGELKTPVTPHPPPSLPQTPLLDQHHCIAWKLLSWQSSADCALLLLCRGLMSLPAGGSRQASCCSAPPTITDSACRCTHTCPPPLPPHASLPARLLSLNLFHLLATIRSPTAYILVAHP